MGYRHKMLNVSFLSARWNNSKITLCLSSGVPNLAFVHGPAHHTSVHVNQPQTQTYPMTLESGVVLQNPIFEASAMITSSIVMPTAWITKKLMAPPEVQFLKALCSPARCIRADRVNATKSWICHDKDVPFLMWRTLTTNLAWAVRS